MREGGTAQHVALVVCQLNCLQIFTLSVPIPRKREMFGPWAGGWAVLGTGGPGHGTQGGGQAVSGLGAEVAH